MTTTDFAELHDELRSVARGLLAGRSADWPVLARAGWTGLEVPEGCGGAGASFAEVAVVLGEVGRAAAPSPLLGGVVLAVGALKAMAPNDFRDEMLTAVAAGRTTPAVVLPTDGTTAPRFGVRDGRLSGRAEFVPDALAASDLLMLAEDADGIPVLVRVRADAPGVHRAAQPVLDETRALARVVADGAAVGAGAAGRFAGDPKTAVSGLFDRARTAVACDSLGVSEAMLAATVSYATLRHQFGRPIGSFQAVKHACADMLVQISVGRSLLGEAVRAVTRNCPDADTAVRMAASHIGGAAVDIAGKAMQLHGGIGYTWESGVHVYLKRAALNRSLFGTPAAHRRQLAQRYR